MRPELLSELQTSDVQWVLRAGVFFAKEPDRAALLAKTPTYAELTAQARDVAPKLLAVSPVPLRTLLEELLVLPGAPVGLQWLADSGVLGHILPELFATVNFSQEAGRRHKDVWEHTKQVVWQAPPRPLLRWSALLHDIGKVKTRTYTADGKVTFHRHSEVGARMFDDIGRRFQLDRETHRSARFLILHHLRPNAYLPSWTDSAVRRFAKEIGPLLPDLLDLSSADITSRRPGRRQQGLDSIAVLAGRIQTIVAADAVTPPLPSGLGDAIMQKFRLPPSRLIGDLKRELLDQIELGELERAQETDYYLPVVEALLAKRETPPTACCE